MNTNMEVRKKIKKVFVALCIISGLLAGCFCKMTVETAYAQETENQEFAADVLAQMRAHKEKVDIKKYNLSVEEFRELWQELVNCSPDAYFIAPQSTMYLDSQTKLVASFAPRYLSGIDHEKLQTELKKMMSMVDEEMTDLEKALVIHDYIVAQCTYDKSADPQDLSCTSFSMYGAVVKKTAVCQGYALTFLYAMNELGIECNIIAGGQHAWNQVLIDGQWYHVDCTWDDPEGNKQGYVSHKYFLKDDTYMRQNGTGAAHTWDAEQFVPCTSQKYNSAQVWDQTNNQMVYHDGLWYYTRHKENTNYDCYYAYDFTKNREQQIKELKNIWYVSGNSGRYYPDSTKITTDGNYIYYSTPNAIRVMNFDGSSDRPLVTISGAAGKIYGLNYQNGEITYEISSSSTTGSVTTEKIYTPQAISFVTAKSGIGAAVTYRTGAPSIAAVAADGKVTAKGIGSAVITVRTEKIGQYPATTATAKIKITKNTLKNATVKGLKTMTYTGKALKPAVTVSVGGVKLPSSAYTVKYSNNKNAGIAKVVITGKGFYTGTRTLNFSIKPAKAKISSVRSTKKKTVTVKWKAVAGATGYQIYRATSKNGTYKRVATVTGKKTVSKKLSVKSGKKYYYKVRAYKKISGKTLYGSFSSTLSGKAK